jgi:hypothetical protein
MVEDGNWKSRVAVAAVVLAVGFAVYQYRSVFMPLGPASLQMREHESQRIPKLRETNSAFWQFSQLLHLVRTKAAARQVDKYSVQVMELDPDANNGVLWEGETVRNEGFDPLPDVEHDFWIDSSRVLGCYTAEGAPLAFRTRLNPPRTGQLVVTIHLNQPMAPGATEFLFIRERVPSQARPNNNNQRIIGLPPLIQEQDNVEGRGVVLPARAKLVHYFPESHATIWDGPPLMTAWTSDDFKGTYTAVWIMFAMP